MLTIPTDMFGHTGSVGVGERSVWVLVFGDRDKTLVRYYAARGDEQARIPLPGPGSGVLAAGGSVWVTAASRPELYQVGPGSNAIVTTVAHADHTSVQRGDIVWLYFDRRCLMQAVAAATAEVTATVATDTAMPRATETSPLAAASSGPSTVPGSWRSLVRRARKQSRSMVRQPDCYLAGVSVTARALYGFRARRSSGLSRRSGTVKVGGGCPGGKSLAQGRRPDGRCTVDATPSTEQVRHNVLKALVPARATSNQKVS
jgi:hypothetical protein